MLFFYKNNFIQNQNEKCKFLGIILQTNLMWEEHVTYVAAKLYKNIFALRKLISSVSFNTAKTMYYGTIHSNLLYGIILWGNSNQASRIFLLQKQAIRVLCKVGYREHCKNLFIEHNILTFPCLYILHIALFIKENLCKLQTNSNFHYYPTRKKDDIRLQLSKSKLSRTSPYYIGSLIFNKLPFDIKKIY